MKKKDPLSRIVNSGIWLQPIIIIIIAAIYPTWREQALACLLLSFLPPLLIFTGNSRRISKDDIERPAATYPPVNKTLLRDVPQPGDIILGRYNQKYVVSNINTDAHYLIIGGSGSGKSSSIIIPTLLYNPNTPAFVIDIKGELSTKAARLDNNQICIFNPQDCNAYGYDPLYALSSGSSAQEAFETMQNIAFSLIPKPAGLKDYFWITSARDLLIGLLLYYYHLGYNTLVALLDQIFASPVKNQIDEIIQEIDPATIEYTFIVKYSDMPPETLADVYAELSNATTIFTTDADVRRALGPSGKKIDPTMLNGGYSIYLSIREEKLSAYYNLIQLIINQTLAELEKRPENSDPILFIVDELPRLLSAGKLERLMDATRTLRSRKVRLMLVTQSLEALMIAYSENEAVDLLSNCAYKIILDASSERTQRMVINWGGKYKERHQSQSSGKDKSTSMSYEEKDIILASDLMTLSQKDELILISPYGYNRIQKCPYYQDRTFKRISSEIAAHNHTIQELQAITHQAELSSAF